MSLVLDALANARSDQTRARLSDGTHSLNAGQILAAADTLADALLRHAVRRAAATLDNGVAGTVLELACRRASVVFLQLPGFFSASQRGHALADAGIDALIGLEGEIELSLGLRLRRIAHRPRILPLSTAAITYTSGSTGSPKGVCLSGNHLDLVAQSIIAALGEQRPVRHLALLPQSVLLESVAGIAAGLMAGAEVLLPPLEEVGLRGGAAIDGVMLANCIDRHAPESLILVPQMLRVWLDALDAGARLPSSLRFCAIGGARVGMPLLARAQAHGIPLFEGYGLSECASVLSLNVPEARRTGSVGRALQHIQLNVEDGEIVAIGPHFLGYVGSSAVPGTRYATGDLGWIDADGFLHLTGRRGNRFITAFGRNVSPEWIESELAAHPAIEQAFVDGEARSANVAVIVPRSGASPTAIERAVSSVNAGLPDYARAHLWLMADESFSLANGESTANGRLRRGLILGRYRQRIDALAGPVSEQQPVETT